MSEHQHGHVNTKGTIVAGWICAIGSILILPIIFMPLGIVLGVYNVSNGETNHGIGQMAVAILFGILGMAIGGAGLGV